jgi:hypothetical protein
MDKDEQKYTLKEIWLAFRDAGRNKEGFRFTRFVEILESRDTGKKEEITYK